jgi:hypothetical protein
MTGKPCLALEDGADDPEVKMATASACTGMAFVGIRLVPEGHLHHR